MKQTRGGGGLGGGGLTTSSSSSGSLVDPSMAKSSVDALEAENAALQQSVKSLEGQLEKAVAQIQAMEGQLRKGSAAMAQSKSVIRRNNQATKLLMQTRQSSSRSPSSSRLTAEDIASMAADGQHASAEEAKAPQPTKAQPPAAQAALQAELRRERAQVTLANELDDIANHDVAQLDETAP